MLRRRFLNALALGGAGSLALGMDRRTVQAATCPGPEYVQLAADPEAIIVGVITRDDNGTAVAASVVWPDGSPGTYTATPSNSYPGCVDTYTVTYGDPVTRTYTQPTVTRNEIGAVTVRPAITVD